MADPIPCKSCGKDLRAIDTQRRAVLSILVQGDERTLSWWFCQACNAYTRREYVDRFHSDPDEYFYGPFPKEVGDADIARVAKCPAWDDKWCTCETHKYFESV